MIKRRILTIAAVTSILMSYGRVSAQVLGVADSTQHPIAITLEDAVRIGSMQNPAIDAALQNEKTMLYRRKAAFGYRLPNLSAAANYTYMSQDIGNIDFNAQKDQLLKLIGGSGLPIPPFIIQGLSGLDLSYTLQKRQFALVGATLTVPIYTGGKINAANNAAKINLSKAESQTDQVRSELFAEIAERYWGLALSRHIEILRGEVVVGMQHHMHDATELEANGMIARGEKLYAQMHLSESETAYAKSRRDVQTINTALCGSLSQPGNYMPITSLFISDAVEPITYFKEKTQANNPLLQQVALTKSLAGEGVRAERSAFIPHFVAMGGLDIYNYNLTDQAPKWLVGAGMTFNIFDGLTKEYKYKAAKSQVRQVEAMERKAQTDIMILVEKLYNEMISSREQVKSMAATIAFAQEYLRIKEEAFREGMAPSSDVVDARLNLAKVHTERLAAAYKFDLLLSQLLALSGQSDHLGSYQSGDGYTPIGTKN